MTKLAIIVICCIALLISASGCATIHRHPLLTGAIVGSATGLTIALATRTPHCPPSEYIHGDTGTPPCPVDTTPVRRLR